MKKMAFKTKTLYYALIVFMITFYGVNFWFSTIVRYLFVVIATLLHVQLFGRTKIFPLFVIYFLIVWLNYITGDIYYHELKYVLLNNMYLLATMTMTYYLFTYRQKTQDIMKAILAVVVFVIAWHGIVTALFDTTIPGIVRTVNQMIKEGVPESAFASYYKLGMVNYAFPHSIPLIIPPIVMVIRSRDYSLKERGGAIVLLLLSLALVYFSGASGPLLVSIVIVLLSFVVVKGRVSRNIGTIVFLSIIILPFLFNDELMLSLLEWVDGLIGGEGHFHGKVLAFQETILSGEVSGDIEARQNRYLLDIEGFLSNILWGTQTHMGGHSVILTRLASLGLIGFVPLVYMFVYHIQFVLKFISRDVRIYYYIGLLAAFMMFLTKAIITWEMLFFSVTILPVSIYLLQNYHSRTYRT